MRNRLQITEAEPSDIPALTLLLAQLFSMEEDFRPNGARQANGLKSIIGNRQAGRIFVLRNHDRIIGMANALFTISTAEGGPVILLEDVIVAEGYRHKGLGQTLVQHVLDWARENGFLRVTLLADRDNAPALQFYEKLGFLPSAMSVFRHSL